MSNLLKNLLFALGLALLLFLGYWLFLKSSDNSGTTTTTVATSQEALLQTQEFVARLNELDSMKIDTSIVSDARFASLVNFRQPIPEEPVGRSNPFAPIQ